MCVQKFVKIPGVFKWYYKIVNDISVLFLTFRQSTKKLVTVCILYTRAGQMFYGNLNILLIYQRRNTVRNVGIQISVLLSYTSNHFQNCSCHGSKAVIEGIWRHETPNKVTRLTNSIISTTNRHKILKCFETCPCIRALYKQRKSLELAVN